MFVRSLVLLSLVALVVGCGPEVDLNRVEGTVTMDGKPLEGARVIFTPKGGGRPAFGLTDANGHYELAFTSTGEGAVAGEYVVSISTFRASEEDVDTGLMTEEVPETVPVVYVRNSQLTATVPGGDYDFELKSDAGEVVQPQILAD